MSKPVLKLAFCMGGGVSKGAFSGGALAEALRQVFYAEAARVLDGGADARRFSSIEIDAFMGASAGAITLSLMLRSLAYSLEGEGQLDGDELVQSAREDFRHYFPSHSLEGLRGVDESLYWNIIEIARVHLIQHSIWVDELSIERMIDRSSTPGAAGLLNPELFGQLGAKYAGFNVDSSGELRWDDSWKLQDDKKILANRVIFGATLTSFHPINQSSKTPPNVVPGDVVLNGWLNKQTSRVARIFDLQFQEGLYPKSQSSWVKVKPDQEDVSDTTYTLDLKKPETWWEMIRTGVTSGAFPGAFDPIILRRHKSEFSGTLSNAIFDDDGFVSLPYSDGGALNNEPLEEVVKLCEYLDEGQDNTVRLIFLVDSSIPDADPVRAFGYQSLVFGDEGKEDRLMMKRSNLRDTVPELKQTESGNNIKGSLLSTVGAVLGHTQITAKTPIFDTDYLPRDTSFSFSSVCAIGPARYDAANKVLIPTPLKSEPLSAFGGFIMKNWRESDYAKGRISVHDIFTFQHTDPGSLIYSKSIYSTNPLLEPPPLPAFSEERLKEERDSAEGNIKDLAEHVADKLDEVLPWFLGLADNPFVLKKVLSKQMTEALFKPTPTERKLQLMLPGDGWKMAFAQEHSVGGIYFTSGPAKGFSVFEILLKFTDQYPGVPEADDLELGFANIASEFVPTDLTCSRLMIDWAIPPCRATNDFTKACVKALQHGAWGIQGEVTPEGQVRWSLFQPLNRIDLGLTKPLEQL